MWSTCNDMDLYLRIGMFTTERRKRLRLRTKRGIMELYLQFGHGMMQHCRHLITEWGGGTAVLSPRDLNTDQLHRLATNITDLDGGRVLLDPQFYLPHADHERLCAYDYWPSSYETGSFFEGQPLLVLLEKLRDLNGALGSYAMLLPGLLAAEIDDDWLESQRAVLDEGRNLLGDRLLYPTIALSADAVRSQDQIASLLEAASDWRAKGYYIVCEHPNGEYLVEDPNWLANVLDLAAGLRLVGAKVILGYCNHQMLVAATAKTNAICSGTWMNVRSFPPGKFRRAYDEEVRRRATWYYCPQALSEYKIPFLDVAHRQNVLHRMAPAAELDGGYASHLFDGPQPTAIGLTEQLAFRHYLHCLRGQVRNTHGTSYDEAVGIQDSLLDNAEELLGDWCLLSKPSLRSVGRHERMAAAELNRS